MAIVCEKTEWIRGRSLWTPEHQYLGTDYTDQGDYVADMWYVIEGDLVKVLAENVVDAIYLQTTFSGVKIDLKGTSLSKVSLDKLDGSRIV